MTLASTDGFGVDLDDLSLKLQLSQWHNTLNPLDVTADGHVVAADALAIINWINAFDANKVPDDAPFGPPYYDVSNDFFVAPNDALAVINFINSGLGGEGEASDEQAPVDQFFNDLGSQQPGAVSALYAPNGQADLFAALANDTAQQSKRRRLYW